MSVSCGNDYSSSQEWRSVPILVKKDSPRLGPTLRDARYEGSQYRSHLYPHRSPKKRVREETPTPPPGPKPHPTPIESHPPNDSLAEPIIESTTLSQPSPIAEGQLLATRAMEHPAWIRDLTPARLLELQGQNEGRLRMGKISRTVIEEWVAMYPDLLESDNLRYEYNPINQYLVIQCMPLPIHDSLQIYFGGKVSVGLAKIFGESEAMSMAVVASGTTFSGFRGDGFRTTRKHPDAYISLPDAQFPTVVCEAGWAESGEDLKEDARLWLLHTNGETRIVIVISFTEIKPRPKPTHAHPNSHTSTNTPAGEENEDSLLQNISEETELHELAQKLFELDKEGKLQHPLLGKVNASVHLYRAAKDGKDIEEALSAKLLPPPDPEDKRPAPAGFGITMNDLLGSKIPEGSDPTDEIFFAFTDLGKVIKSSLPRTARLRATDRAIKLLEPITGLEEEGTFTQRKRQRRSPIGRWE